LTLAEDSLAPPNNTNHEALLIHIEYIPMFKLISSNLLVQQLKVELILQLRISQVTRAIHGVAPL
jgi:hypothetical protein